VNQFIVAIGLALLAVLLWRRWVQRRQVEQIEGYPFRQFLDQRLVNRYPRLLPEQREAVFAALRDYFLLCHRAGRRELSMPSRAAGDLWQEFTLQGPRYEKFCRAAFGRRLRHMPSEVMGSPKQADLGLRHTWRLACALEDIDPQSTSRQPRLFALDASLGLVFAPADPGSQASRGNYGNAGEVQRGRESSYDGYPASEQTGWSSSSFASSSAGDSSGGDCSSSDSGDCSVD